MQNILRKFKVNFIFLSIKRNILPSIFCIFIISLILFSKNNISAAKGGLLLWANNVVPSLLPFFIATELISHTNVVSKLGKILNPIMKIIFNVPGIGSYPLLMGIISGYPTGAKIVTDFKENGLCSQVEAERMLAFTNNSGPLFILGTVGITLFGNSLIGILLLITHVLACLSVGFVFRFWKNNKGKSYIYKTSYNSDKKYVSFSNLGEILGNSIMSSIKTVFMIGGFIVLFSVILSILKDINFFNMMGKFLFPIFKLFGIDNFDFVTSFLAGFLEITNGIMQISKIPCKYISTNILLTAFLLGFGGISVLLQVYSIISKSNISIKPYFIGKLLHGIFAVVYTFIFISIFPVFNLNL